MKKLKKIAVFDFSEDIQFEILQYLNYFEVLSLSVLNKNWYDACMKNHLWELLHKRTFLNAPIKGNSYYESFKMYYFHCYAKNSFLGFGNPLTTLIPKSKKELLIEDINQEVLVQGNDLYLCSGQSLQSYNLKNGKLMFNLNILCGKNLF